MYNRSKEIICSNFSSVSPLAYVFEISIQIIIFGSLHALFDMLEKWNEGLRKTASGENAKSLNTSRKGNTHSTANCLHSAVGSCQDSHVMNPKLKQLLLLYTEYFVCSFLCRNTPLVVFREILLLYGCIHSFHSQIEIILQ